MCLFNIFSTANLLKQLHITPFFIRFICLLYDQEKGVNNEPQCTLSYFQSAANKNLPVAQYYLGMKYYAGLNIDKNTIKGRQLLKTAMDLPNRIWPLVFLPAGGRL